MVARGVEDVEFEIGQEWADELAGEQKLKFVVAHVDHEALEAAKVVAFETALAGCEDAGTEFGDEGFGPQTTAQAARDDYGRAGVFDDPSFAGDFAVTEVATIFLNGGFAGFGVVGVDDLVE